MIHDPWFFQQKQATGAWSSMINALIPYVWSPKWLKWLAFARFCYIMVLMALQVYAGTTSWETLSTLRTKQSYPCWWKWTPMPHTTYRHCPTELLRISARRCWWIMCSQLGKCKQFSFKGPICSSAQHGSCGPLPLDWHHSDNDVS